MRVFNLWPEGHRLSDRFRQIMGRLINYARDMDTHIKIMCQDLRDEFEATIENNEAEIKLFGIDPGPRPNLFSSSDGVVNDVNEQYEQENALYHKKLEQQLDELTEEEREQLESLEYEIDALKHELDDFIEDYPQILFQSLFIAVYSNFERYLNDLCNDLRKSGSFPMGRKDLKATDQLESVKKFFKKVARLNFPDNTKEWQDILLLSEVRHKIVHNPELNFRFDEKDENIKLRNPELQSYFWLDDPHWHDPPWDDYDIESTSFTFSLDSIKKIIDTFVRFSKDIDKVWEEHNNILMSRLKKR